MSDKIKTPKNYITPLNINLLNGRVANLPAKTLDKRNIDILFIYGHHSSLERWWGLIQAFSKYGNVVAPDLPGFGGMESLYKIGKKPNTDNLADYLAAFIDHSYKDKKLIVVGMSFGFAIVTRMLQRRPDLSENVALLISIVGFANSSEFTFSKTRHKSYIAIAKVFKHRPLSAFFRYVVLNSLTLKTVYARTHNAKSKFSEELTKDEFNHLMDIEIDLWHNNEIRTYMSTTIEMLTIDNTHEKVNLPVWHIYAKSDHFFDNKTVEKDLRSIYLDFHPLPTDLVNHAPSVIADEAAAAKLIPVELDILLNNLK
jgi:pimeloyl-ACP methyl ester carboxylesterase